MSETASPPVPTLGRPWNERFPGPAPQPIAAGGRMELREGMRVLGFFPAERRKGLSCRPIGPEPEAVICLGALAPEVARLSLTFLGPAEPEAFGPVRLVYEGQALATQAVRAPDRVAALLPEAWALEAELPPADALPRPAWGRLDILFDRVLPDPDPRAARWAGPSLHTIEFLG
ncbi:hypothetical protein D9599_03740 [Roseomonas sp. KE2513]|uniref:hypothetical protein n=1 Tax=Roseomonas sp. KE2513 TaxID=2479202 RepID=UPI0018DF7771|nr:hypothetical protein [Roseomonas sp. KE2513]MBI0534681.1 hypothetical protein [Roseomonas sp. KE2513]